MLGRKLIGARVICEVLGWSESKLYTRIDEMRKAGVIYDEMIGSPPHKRIVAFEGIIERYIISYAQAQYEEGHGEKKKGADGGPR